MEFAISRIIESKNLTETVYKMTFMSENAQFTAPGQYAVVHHEGENIRIPVTEYDSDRFILVFDIDTDSKKSLSELKLGESVVVETGVGTGFDIEAIPDNVTLVAEGMGIPPMMGLLRMLLISGKNYNLILCYPNKKNIFMIDQFRNLCSNIDIITIDGSNGREGHSYDALRKAKYVCAFAEQDVLEKIKEKTEDLQEVVLL